MVVCPGRVIASVIIDLQSHLQSRLIGEVDVNIHIIVLHDEIQIAVGITAVVTIRRIGVKFDICDIVTGICIDPGADTRSR